MEIIADSLDFQLNRETAIAIGKFDGVHVGHRRLLEEILEKKKDGLAACVFTFDISPAVVFGIGDGKVLTTREEKRELFEELGVDVLVEFPMNTETAAIPAEDFARRYLSAALCARFIAAGEDLSFGQYGKGDARLLCRLSEELSFEVKTISKVRIEDTEVSSTYIRALLERGEMERVSLFLGESFSVQGVVQHGKHLGHSIGFPTINLYPEGEKLLPPFGVYRSKVRVGEDLYQGISNVGMKPTIGGETKAGVETFLYDFDGDLYGREAKVYLEHFMRPEKRFDSLEALKAQIARDVLEGRGKE